MLVCFPLFSFPKNPISPSKVASHFEDPKTPGPEKQVHSPGSECVTDPERETRWEHGDSMGGKFHLSDQNPVVF